MESEPGCLEASFQQMCEGKIVECWRVLKMTAKTVTWLFRTLCSIMLKSTRVWGVGHFISSQGYPKQMKVQSMIAVGPLVFLLLTIGA